MKSLFKFSFFLIFSIALFLNFTLSNYSQTPTNFSGKWTFDKKISTLTKLDVDFDGTVILEIIQNQSKFSYTELYQKSGQQDWKTSPEIFNLNGKEEIIKNDNGINKKYIQWSEDKSFLTTYYIDINKNKGKEEVFKIIDKYTLSADKKILTIERTNDNPVTGKLESKKIYKRK